MSTVTEGFQLTDELREWFKEQNFPINLQARTQAFIEHYHRKEFQLSRQESWVAQWKRWITADAKNPKYMIKPPKPQVIYPGSLADVEYGEPTTMPDQLRRLIKRGMNVTYHSPSNNEIGQSEVCLPDSEGTKV